MDCRLITVPFGPLDSNMYIITGSAGAFIVDPSVDPKKAEDVSGIKGLSTGEGNIKGFLLTHGHHDHIKYIDAWQKAYPDANVFFSSNDKELLGNGFMNCSYMEGSETVYTFKFTNVAGMYGMNIFKDGDFEIKVFETPGHTMGSVCFLVSAGEESMLFTGDTVFAGSVGRTDMPGGNSKELMNSVKRISKFPPELKVYPGHGPASTIGDEIRFNPFFEI